MIVFSSRRRFSNTRSCTCLDVGTRPPSAAAASRTAASATAFASPTPATLSDSRIGAFSILYAWVSRPRSPMTPCAMTSAIAWLLA